MDQNKSNKTIIVALIILIISMTFIFIMDKTKQTDTSEETNADKLYAHKSEYIGDSSNISGLLNLLPYSEYKTSIELSTSDKPYGLKAIYNIGDSAVNISDLKNQFYNNALIVFSLIENVDYIDFELIDDDSAEPEIHHYDRKEIQDSHIDNLYGYSADLQTFENFLMEKVYMPRGS